VVKPPNKFENLTTDHMISSY